MVKIRLFPVPIPSDQTIFVWFDLQLYYKNQLVVHPALKLAERAVGGATRVHHHVHERVVAI